VAKAQRTAVYVRISRDRATEVSTDVQEETCRKLIKARGWKLTEVYVDRGRSAFDPTAKRPAFDRMQADVEAGAVDVVVSYKLDRLARSVAGFADLDRFLQQHGADVVLATQPIDTTGASGKLLRNVLAAFAEFESELKSERIGGAMAHKARAGLPHPGGTRLFGYTSDRSELVKDEAALIRQAAKRVLRGDAMYAIAQDWNERGLVTPVGNEWKPQVLGRLLRNPFLAGLREYDGEVIEGSWPAVLDRETHTELLAYLDDPARRTSDTTRRKHLLAGLLTCGACGALLVTRSGGDGARYTCATGPGRPGCGKISVDARFADPEVRDRVLALVAGNTGELSRLKGAPSKAELRRVRVEVEQLTARREELARDWATGAITRPEWVAARDALNEALAAAESLVNVLSAPAAMPDVPDTLPALTRWWKRAPLERQRALVDALAETITVRAARQRGRWDPERIAVIWRA
jgi:DNA invertase Pin-like site-specific DNA recombinase